MIDDDQTIRTNHALILSWVGVHWLIGLSAVGKTHGPKILCCCALASSSVFGFSTVTLAAKVDNTLGDSRLGDTQLTKSIYNNKLMMKMLVGVEIYNDPSKHFD